MSASSTRVPSASSTRTVKGLEPAVRLRRTFTLLKFRLGPETLKASRTEAAPETALGLVDQTSMYPLPWLPVL